MGEVVSGLDTMIRALVAAEVARQLAAFKPEVDEYLSTGEAAELAGVAVGTVRRWIREGRLSKHRAGRHLRVERSELESLLRNGHKPKLTPAQRAELDFR